MYFSTSAPESCWLGLAAASSQSCITGSSGGRPRYLNGSSAGFWDDLRATASGICRCRSRMLDSSWYGATDSRGWKPKYSVQRVVLLVFGKLPWTTFRECTIASPGFTATGSAPGSILPRSLVSSAMSFFVRWLPGTTYSK